MCGFVPRRPVLTTAPGTHTAAFGLMEWGLLVAIALRWGLNPNDLKLVTAVFVFAALVLPGGLKLVVGKLAKGRCNA